MRRSALSMPARALAETAVRWKPAGSSAASSPWLIQTWRVAGRPAKSGDALSSMVTSAWPYSRVARRAHLAAEVMHDEVQPIADAQHRHAQFEQFRVGGGRVGIVDRRRPAGEDEAERLERLNLGDGRRAGQHDGEDVLLADAPRDQLRVLRTEIEDDDCLGGHVSSVAGRIAGLQAESRFLKMRLPRRSHSLELICKVLKI